MEDLLGFIVVGIIGLLVLIIALTFGKRGIEFLFLGIVVILMGGRILYEPKFYSYKFQHDFDFTGYNIPLGIFMIVVGALFIWNFFKNKNEKSNEKG